MNSWGRARRAARLLLVLVATIGIVFRCAVMQVVELAGYGTLVSAGTMFAVVPYVVAMALGAWRPVIGLSVAVPVFGFDLHSSLYVFTEAVTKDNFFTASAWPAFWNPFIGLAGLLAGFVLQLALESDRDDD